MRARMAVATIVAGMALTMGACSTGESVAVQSAGVEHAMAVIDLGDYVSVKGSQRDGFRVEYPDRTVAMWPDRGTADSDCARGESPSECARWISRVYATMAAVAN